MPTATAKLSQSQILRKLGVKNPTDPAFKNQIGGNGRLQQYYNTQAALHGLPHPFDPSLASTIIQDVLPLAAIFGAGAASAGAGGATEGTGGAGASSFLSSAGGKIAGAGLAGLLGLTSDWQQLLVRALEALAGVALLLLGLQALTGTGSQGNPAAAVRGMR